jgi:hypothetical protein
MMWNAPSSRCAFCGGIGLDLDERIKFDQMRTSFVIQSEMQ